MGDVYDLLARAVIVIKEDAQLKECFNRVLAVGSSTQQARVATLLAELKKLKAPDSVMTFVRLLTNDQLAQQILRQINS